MLCLVTGATGFVGGHVAERLLNDGWQVRTVARPTSDRRQLEGWAIDVVEGDLTDPTTAARAVAGVDAVVHCAAKVGDWGPLAEYRRVNVDGLRTLCDAVLA